MSKPLPSQARLHELFYCVDGVLYRKHAKRGHKPGRAGTLANNNRWQLCIDGSTYQVSRLVWMYYMGTDPGDDQIDHINHNTTDNSIWNLQRLPALDNNRKRANRMPHNPPGTQRRANGRYRAQIWYDGRNHTLGTFDTAEEAHQAYLQAVDDTTQHNHTE